MVDVSDTPPTDPSAPGRHFRPPRLRRWPRRILLAVNILTLLVIVASAVGTVEVVRLFGTISRKNVTSLAPTPKHFHLSGPKAQPFTMLIVGSDTRALKTPTGLDIGNTATNAEALGDSIVLARVVPARHEVALLSIPRDLWVDVPGLGYSKINAAYAGGNATRLVATIEQRIGIPINHFAAVNFDTLEAIADAIGGVEQFFPTPAFDEESDLSVPKAGCINLIGPQALAFVRSRNYFYVLDGQPHLQLSPESDLGRIQRQQAFIRNVLHKAERTGALSNVFTLRRIIDSLAANLTLDSRFSDSDIVTLASEFRHLNATIPSWTYPVVNGQADGQDVLLASPAADAAQVAQFEQFGEAAAAAPTTSTSTTPTSSTSTTVAPTTVATLPADQVSVAVYNGSGTVGQAGTAAEDLRSAGFAVTAIGDAATYGYSANQIDYGPSGLVAARTLQAALAGGASLVADPALPGDQLDLYTGRSFTGLATPGSGSPGSSSGTTVAPTTTTPATTVPATTTTTAPADGNSYQSATAVVASSSSYYKGVYIPPGRVPGQPVSTCGN